MIELILLIFFDYLLFITYTILHFRWLNVVESVIVEVQGSESANETNSVI